MIKTEKIIPATDKRDSTHFCTENPKAVRICLNCTRPVCHGDCAAMKEFRDDRKVRLVKAGHRVVRGRYEFRGEWLTLHEICRRTGASYYCVQPRVLAGMSVEDAISQPKRPRGVTLDGVHYPNIDAAAKAYHVGVNTVYKYTHLWKVEAAVALERYIKEREEIK